MILSTTRPRSQQIDMNGGLHIARRVDGGDVDQTAGGAAPEQGARSMTTGRMRAVILAPSSR